jgi:hypothetical protein
LTNELMSSSFLVEAAMRIPIEQAQNYWASNVVDICEKDTGLVIIEWG